MAFDEGQLILHANSNKKNVQLKAPQIKRRKLAVVAQSELGGTSTGSLIRANTPHVCTSSCRFVPVHPSQPNHLRCTVDHTKVHLCGRRCMFVMNTNMGRKCRLTNLLLDRDLLPAQLRLAPLVSGTELALDTIQREEMVFSTEREQVKQLHPRVQAQKAEMIAWRSIEEKKQAELDDQRAVLMHQVVERTAMKQRTEDPTDKHRCTPECDFEWHAQLGQWYECKKYGRLHQCGSACSAAEERRGTVKMPQSVANVKNDHLRDDVRAASTGAESRVCSIRGRVIESVIGAPSFDELQNMRPDYSGRSRKTSDQAAAKDLSTVDQHEDESETKTLTVYNAQNDSSYAEKRAGLLKMMHNLVYDLLFSDKRRNHDRRQFERSMSETKKNLIRYVRSCKLGEKPISVPILRYIYVEEIKHRCANIRPYWNPDLTRTHYYAERCLQFWTRLIPDLVEKPRVKSHVLNYVVSFLYYQHDGLPHLDKGQILDPDPDLRRLGLPDKNDLEEFGVKSHHYVDTLKKVRALVFAAMERGMTLADLRIPLSSNELSADWIAAGQMIRA